ncbi:MAG: thioredoxin domain-containing protein [Solirubrobacterales bacterium]|nr:thioredoxin domain-containing protein [Solirubrobacterales bacterium]
MASRTKQKEEARARRLAEEQARAERMRRQRRLRMVGGTVLAAVVVVVALVLINISGSKKGGIQTGTQVNATVTAVNSLLSGIPQSGGTLGNPNAPVTMTYYGDLKCPVCQAFTLQGGFPQLVSNDVRSGKVKVVYSAFCTATCGGPDPSEFPTQQAAALAAGKQNRFWQFAELFYRQQGSETDAYVTEAFLDGLARQVTGLDFAQWKTARNDPNLASQVNSEQSQGRAIGVPGTPTLVFKGPKGQAVAQGAVPTYVQLENAVKQVS